MAILWITSIVLFSLWMCPVHCRNIIRYASSCSVELCVPRNANDNNNTTNGTINSTCSNLPVCYLFDTSINTTVCAPQVICSLFDPCNSLRRCATNTSVCVINTCCTVPICMPLSLATSCSMYMSNNTRDSSSVTICPNATWSDNSTIIINGNLINNNWASLGDFVVDNNNNLFVIDSTGSRVLKFALNNPSVYNVAAITNYTAQYQPNNLYVDGNGSIYTAESMYQISNMAYSYRIVKYNQNNILNGTVVYGPTTCGTGANELCWCSSLFVDRTGSIYYSDSSNQRVLKITPFASSASVVAGISGSFGSSVNQLSNPSGIYVDGNGALYVSDQGNYRVMKFASGSLTGTVLFTMPSYQSPVGLTVDNAGSVYVGTYSGIFKYIPASSTTIQVASQVYWGVNRIRLDTNGNLYTSGYSSSNIYKYNITANTC